jgi:hypothetical protein
MSPASQEISPSNVKVFPYASSLSRSSRKYPETNRMNLNPADKICPKIRILPTSIEIIQRSAKVIRRQGKSFWSTPQSFKFITKYSHQVRKSFRAAEIILGRLGNISTRTRIPSAASEYIQTELEIISGIREYFSDDRKYSHENQDYSRP